MMFDKDGIKEKFPLLWGRKQDIVISRLAALTGTEGIGSVDVVCRVSQGLVNDNISIK